MNEGWHGDDYLILFTELEVAGASDRYGISTLLPGYEIIGLRGWDDFIVRDSAGRTYSVPTVPVEFQYLSPFAVPDEEPRLRSDARFSGKIKWYVKPIVFGGDTNVGENLTWISHDQHAQLVRWWNNQYRSAKVQAGKQQS
jgi:hypothetical protein